MNTPQADLPLTPSDPLPQLNADYPEFRIWREETADGLSRYIARSQHLGVSPHTVVTTDPGELRTALSNADAQSRVARSQPADSGARQFEPGTPHPARIYNVWLGGKDGLAADRRVAAEVAACRPQVVVGARANRAFLARAVRYLAGECGIRQYLDIGPGLPAPGNTHEVAQAIAPECKIVYVDYDPLVLTYARALLTSSREGVCEILDADLREPETILKDAAQTLDFTQPVGVLLIAVLHFLTDADDPQGAVATLASGLAPGSFVAVSHLTADMAPEAVAAGMAAYNDLVPAGITARSHAQVTALFGDLSLVAPGVVPVTEWRPDFHARSGQVTDMYAGLATIRRLR